MPLLPSREPGRPACPWTPRQCSSPQTDQLIKVCLNGDQQTWEAIVRQHRRPAMANEKRQAAADVPFLNWRYILFKWNDSDDEMNLARRRAADPGVDRLTWEITDHPEEAFSRRFVPGSPDYAVIEREVWDDNNLGNAIPNATPRARIDVRRPMPGLPLIGRSKRQLRLETEVRNLSSRPFPA